MHLIIEIEQEEDGRWLTEVPEIPSVMAYSKHREEAILKVQVLTLRVLADQLEHGEVLFDINTLFMMKKLDPKCGHVLPNILIFILKIYEPQS